MILLTYGSRQTFRLRHGDINVIGRLAAPVPSKAAEYRINDGPSTPFYVEPDPDPGIDWSFEYKRSPARLRLTDAGDFNVEIPVSHPSLRQGENLVNLRLTDATGVIHTRDIVIEWDPKPIALPLSLTSFGAATSVQDVGQVVNGAFDLDKEAGVLRTRGPAKPDSLLLLGSPHGSQEATYAFRFYDGSRSKYIGLSDFFMRHEAEDPSLLVKPGWSTAGLATLRPRGEFAWEARVWIAQADRPGWRPQAPQDSVADKGIAVVRTDPPAQFRAEPRVTYRVRHQVLLSPGQTRARFRVWPDGQEEPAEWLCDEEARGAAAGSEATASFGLFMHSGLPSEWWDIEVRSLNPR